MRRLPGIVLSVGVPGLLALGLLWACVAQAQGAGQTGRATTHSRSELQQDVARMQGVVRACGEAAATCESSAVPADEVVEAEGERAQFTLRWSWLREALDAAKGASAGDRQQAMQASAARLGEIEQQAGADDGVHKADFAKPRRVANEVLARPEFGGVVQPTWWDRMLARVWEWLGELFAGVGRLGAHAPWLGKALEWLFFIGAAVGLLVFAQRNFQRQRLAASLRSGTSVVAGWDREATDWASLADAAAEAGDWREAVHCLYWAAIVRLESRRAWRHNPARTPREYVLLLKPGSVQRESLGGLTGLLERVWYGLRPAGADEYERARMWFERLSEAGGLAGGPGSGRG